MRAADGSVWASDPGCDRLVRVAPDGTSSVVELTEGPEELAPDPAGGVWYAATLDGFGGHVDAAGRVSRIRSDERRPTSPWRRTVACGSRSGGARSRA